MTGWLLTTGATGGAEWALRTLVGTAACQNKGPWAGHEAGGAWPRSNLGAMTWVEHHSYALYGGHG